jgi:hypothetical protein
MWLIAMNIWGKLSFPQLDIIFGSGTISTELVPPHLGQGVSGFRAFCISDLQFSVLLVFRLSELRNFDSLICFWEGQFFCLNLIGGSLASPHDDGSYT